MTGIMIGFTRARHLLGTVYGNYSLNSIDTGLNVYGSGLYGIGGATLTLPASPSTLQTIEINNTGTGTVIVPGTLTKSAVNYLRAELAPKAKIKIRWNGTTWDVIYEYGTIVYIPLPVYAVLMQAPSQSPIDSLTNGNLTASHGYYGGEAGYIIADINKSTGKWYFEVTRNGPLVGVSDVFIGFKFASSGYGALYGPQYNENPSPQSMDIFRIINGTNVYNYGLSCNVGDVIGIAVDCDSGTLAAYLNGTNIDGAGNFLYNAATSISINFVMYVSGDTITANFGASAFTYSVPSGYNSGLYT